eukprot:COSAG05_NODE_112_length_18489_cov_15.556281_11_plen_62_part_00
MVVLAAAAAAAAAAAVINAQIDDIFATDEFRPHLSLMHDVPHIFSLLTQRLGALLSSEAAR